MTPTDSSSTQKSVHVPGPSIPDAPYTAALAKPHRQLGLDLLRLVATYMVMQIHSGEFFYIGAGGNVINNADSVSVGWMNSLFRCCVPLFIMLSGYFLFPVDERTFYRKRFGRIVSPFLIWCVLFALYYYFRGEVTLPDALRNIAKIPVNYGTDVGHLWFVYMLAGIYLIAPVVSPWVQSASQASMRTFLALWAVSLAIPYIHQIFPAIWGECSWNHTPTLYYFSGFLGYAILAAYIRRFHAAPSMRHTLVGVGLIVAGYAVTAFGFLTKLPVDKTIDQLELTWGFETLNVGMMALGFFLLFKNLQPAEGRGLGWRLVEEISPKTYGMYLAHIMLLNTVYWLLNAHIERAAIKLPVFASLTFVSTYLVIKALSFLPKSKWIIG